MANNEQEVRYMNELFGRQKIFTSVTQINDSNILEEVRKALVFHNKNMLEEDYLYWYRRGMQPILGKHKEVRPEINNVVTENHAEEIVTFKNGYFLTQPAYYVSRTKDKGTSDKVKKLNEYLYRSGKQLCDNKLVDWFHTVGLGVLFVRSNDNPEIPVKAFALDPRSAFVVYDIGAGNEPVMGINVVMADETKTMIDVFTKDSFYRLSGATLGKIMTPYPNKTATPIAIESVQPNILGEIPIIEYRYNSVNMGAFEAVIPMLDAINTVISNRVDGVEQFIQSLAIAVNCQFEEGTTANDIRKSGMIILKSIGENKADFKILSEQLDQSQTQVLVDDLYRQVLTICGMPSTNKDSTSSSDNVGAVIFRNGWYQADSFARNTEDLFKESNYLFDRIFTKVLRLKGILDISLSDFELSFVRNETSNLLVKTQGALNLKQLGLSPEITLAKSGVSNDPVADVANSKKYIDLAWGNTNAPKQENKVETVDGTAVEI